MRLTDERIDEILRPKELMGETELESLAREVRELRESHSVACETCDGLRDSNHELRAENVRLGGEIRSLTTERLDLEERLFKANRQIEEFDVSGKRQDATITRLMTEKGRVEDELSSYKDALRIAQKDRDDWKSVAESIGESVNERDEKVERLTRERDAARELLRRFRASISVVNRTVCQDQVCRDYDSRFGQPQQPEPSGELVPWDAKTRPRGVVMFSFPDVSRGQITIDQWGDDGAKIGGVWMSWKEMLSEKVVWSAGNDGVTWERCGVRK